jgi:transglutaminase-like putative cysteine protease
MDESKNKRKAVAWEFFLNLLGLLTIVPLAPMVNRVIPPILIGSFNADLLIAVTISFLFVRFVLWIFKPLIIPSFLMVGVIFLINMFTNTYTVSGIVTDYKNLVVNNWNKRSKKEKDLFLVKPSLFDSEVDKAVKGMTAKINQRDSLVRKFAVSNAVKYYTDSYRQYGNVVRILSLFRYINHNFKYVSDPLRDEYYASPMETIDAGLAGDCDDHTILMIAAMKSIGAKTRMVLSVDHVYPELYCGNKASFLKFQSAILQLYSQENLTGLYYREENGEYWLNLDYSARYPGGPYANNKAYSVVEF